MSAYNPRTDSPEGIITLEQNLAHDLLLASHLHGNDYYNELGGGILERIAQVSIIQSANKDWRLIGRVSLILQPDYMSVLNSKMWMRVTPWADATIPAQFKTAT